MEKYTKESLAELSHEELENVVLSLQDEVSKEVDTKNMYYDWYEKAEKGLKEMKAKLVVIHNILHTWG